MPHRPRENESASRAETFTTKLVFELLEEAKAPLFWKAPEKLADLAELMVSLSEMAAGVPDPGGHRARMQRAQRAIEELKRVLPELITVAAMQALIPDLAGALALPSDLAAARSRAFKLANLQKSLADLGEGADVPRMEKFLSGWHTAAMALFLSYRSIVGSGAPSKNGPAVRFIRLALTKTGHKGPTFGAIEAALRAHKKIAQS